MRARSFFGAVVVLLGVLGCEAVTPPPAARCVAPATVTAPASAEAVCARLQGLGCVLNDCPAAYAGFAARAAPEDFARLTACYVAAASCDEVDQCARACGPDGGAIPLGPARDAGAVDAGAVDAGAVDAGAVDAGAVDAGAVGAGAVDAGAVDAGAVDAGAVDAGAADAGAADAGAADAGAADAGAVDAGAADADAADAGAADAG